MNDQTKKEPLKGFWFSDVIEQEKSPEFSDNEMNDFLKKAGTLLAGFAIALGLLLFLVSF